jgi:hypothetical protein
VQAPTSSEHSRREGTGGARELRGTMAGGGGLGRGQSSMVWAVRSLPTVGGLAGAVLALAGGGWARSSSWPAAEVASGGHGQCGKVGMHGRRRALASQRKETTCY